MSSVHNNVQDERIWLTLQEASDITGKSTSALRRLIHREMIKSVRKERIMNRTQWLIHRDEIIMPNSCERKNLYGVHDERSFEREAYVHNVQMTDNMNAIPLEYFDGKLKEWEETRSHLEQGLMMYRYKYEELDRKMRLLPAPPEMIQEEIRKRNEITEQARKELSLAQGELAQVRERVCEKEEVIKAEMEHRENLMSELREKQNTIEKAQEIIRDAQQKNEIYQSSLTELQQKLQEEERVRETLKTELERALEEARRPWWKKLLRMK